MASAKLQRRIDAYEKAVEFVDQRRAELEDAIREEHRTVKGATLRSLAADTGWSWSLIGNITRRK